MMNMSFALALLFACIMTAAQCAPCAVQPGAGSGDEPEPTPDLSSFANCATEALVAENTTCNDTEEFENAVGSLSKGLRLLKSYSKKLKCYFANQNNQCQEDSLIRAYLLKDTANGAENFIRILDGYGQLALQALSGLSEDELEAQTFMQGVVDIISALLVDYKKVLAPELCNCQPEEVCTDIFVPLPYLYLGSSCRPHLYVSDKLFEEVSDYLEYLYGEEGRLKMVWSKKDSEELIPITPPTYTDSQWITNHLSSASPLVREYL